MKILLAIDGSPCSDAAVATLIAQYPPAATEVVVLHAVESLRLMPVSYGYGVGPSFGEDYTGIAKQWRREGEELAARTAQRLQAAGFRTTAQVAEDDARQFILEYAKKWQPDLILVGSHGKRGLDRFLLGSVSEAIARHAPCSVEIVRAPALAA